VKNADCGWDLPPSLDGLPRSQQAARNLSVPSRVVVFFLKRPYQDFSQDLVNALDLFCAHWSGCHAGSPHPHCTAVAAWETILLRQHRLLSNHLIEQALSQPGAKGPWFVKIVFFGLTISSSWGNGHATPYRAILRALHRMGHQIHFFEKDVEYYRSRRDLESCDYCQLTFYDHWSSIRRYAIHEARWADAVITASYLPEGRVINDDVLDLARPLRVYYDLDTPITLRNLGAGEIDYLDRRQIPSFDLVLSFVGGPALTELEQKYDARLTRPLYGCVDPDLYQRVDPSPEFAWDLSYMGTYAPDREQKMEDLFLEPARRHPHKRFMLAGSMYPMAQDERRRDWPENVRRIDHVPPEAHPRFYSSSRLTLNLTREEMARNGWCPSGRFFEAAACGTPVLSDWWDGLDWFFDVVHDIRVVTCPEHVANALAMPDYELHTLAAHARQRTLDDHTGQCRARQLLLYLEEARAATAFQKSESAR
jgi:spore maturation protein CgeB